MSKALIYSQEDLDLILELEKEKNEEIQQENKKLNGAIQTYDILLKANTDENNQLKGNWNELKKWLEENESFDDYCNETTFTSVLEKMLELEQGSDSNVKD